MKNKILLLFAILFLFNVAQATTEQVLTVTFKFLIDDKQQEGEWEYKINENIYRVSHNSTIKITPGKHNIQMIKSPDGFILDTRKADFEAYNDFTITPKISKKIPEEKITHTPSISHNPATGVYELDPIVPVIGIFLVLFGILLMFYKYKKITDRRF